MALSHNVFLNALQVIKQFFQLHWKTKLNCTVSLKKKLGRKLEHHYFVDDGGKGRLKHRYRILCVQLGWDQVTAHRQHIFQIVFRLTGPFSAQSVCQWDHCNPGTIYQHQYRTKTKWLSEWAPCSFTFTSSYKGLGERSFTPRIVPVHNHSVIFWFSCGFFSTS